MSRNIYRTIVLLMFILFAGYSEAKPAEAQTEPETKTEYLAVLMNGKKLGYSEHTRSVEKGEVVTTDSMTLDMSRAGFPIKMNIETVTTESTKGEPLGFKVKSNMGGTEKIEEGKIVDGKTIELTTTVMGKQQKITKEYPQGALMSEGLRLQQLDYEFKKGVKFSVKVFDPSIMGAMDAEIEVGDKTQVDLFGRVVELTEVTTTMGSMLGKIKSTSYVDDELNALKTTTPIMGLKLEMLACDKQFAMSPNDDVIDFISGMLLQCPEKVNTDSVQIKYILAPKDNKQITIPSLDNQKVSKDDNGKVVVTVKPVTPAKGESFPYKGTDPKIKEMLKPTRFLQSDDEKVIALAEQAVAGAEDTAQAVKQIEKFVYDYIDAKDLSVGYASATEIVASKQGDCSEHAVLTAAMCRAVGIPARVVTGLVYIDSYLGRENVMGGHAWTEAYVGGKWIGLDATNAIKGYGTGHIALSAGNGESNEFLSLAGTLGYFTIEKIEQ